MSPIGFGRLWGASCEDAVRAVVNRGSADQLESFGAIEYPYNKQMGKAFDVGEARFELRKNFKNAFRVVFGAETLGDLLGILVRTSHIPDWLRRKHNQRSLGQLCPSGAKARSFLAANGTAESRALPEASSVLRSE